MNLISWNVNGLRACMGKGFQSFFDSTLPDFFCLQETKLQPGQLSLQPTDTTSFGTMPRKRAIPEPRFFPVGRLSPVSLDWVIPLWTGKAV